MSSHGSAVPYGSTLGLPLNQPIEHLVPTADGGRYWLGASDGGIFTFGAPFLGAD